MNKVRLIKRWSLLLLFFCFVLLNSGCEESKDIETYPMNELDGLWKVDDSWCIQIEGNQGKLVLFDAKYYAKGLDKFLKKGDIVVKNLNKIDDNLWIGQVLFWWYDKTTGEVTSLDWADLTYSLNSTKNELTECSITFGNMTYYLVDNINDDISNKLKGTINTEGFGKDKRMMWRAIEQK